MSNYIDYKCTIWGRLYFKDNDSIEKNIEKIEQGFLPTELCDEENGFLVFEHLLDTEEFIPPIENDGQSTIEVYNEEGVLIWDNSFESEIKRKNNGT